MWGSHRPLSPITQPGFSIGKSHPHALFVQTPAFQGLLSLTFCANRQCFHTETCQREESLETPETFQQKPNILLSTSLPSMAAKAPCPPPELAMTPDALASFLWKASPAEAMRNCSGLCPPNYPSSRALGTSCPASRLPAPLPPSYRQPQKRSLRLCAELHPWPPAA